MPHDIALIATIATGFGLALIFGYFASHLKMPPLVGYLLAGIAIGPFTPGFVGDIALLTQLAEIGVMLLMFGIGLHFSLNDLLSVKRIAIPGALVQILSAIAMGAGISIYWGWDIGPAFVFGLCLSVASTVVLLRALEAKGVLESINGRIAIGWLVVEDLVMVLVLVMLPAMAGLLGGNAPDPESGYLASHLWVNLGVTIGKVVVFIALMLIVGRKIFPKVLWLIARTGSRELFTLCVIVAAIGVAFGAAMLFDVSFALGAFFAGMMLRESEFSHRAATESLPLRDAFSVLFFVSVGMLFDPSIAMVAPMKLFIVVMIIMVGKTLAAVALVLAFRYPLKTALIVAASLAQIGEFSFILAGLGVNLGVLSVEGQSLVLAGSLISIAANTFLFAAIEPILRLTKKRTAQSPLLEIKTDPLAELPDSVDHKRLTDQAVLIGFGPVGKEIAKALQNKNISHVITDQNREIVEGIRAANGLAVCGDASDPATLIQAHIARAALLIITLEDTFNIRKIIETAKKLNPKINVIIRTHDDEEAQLFRQEELGIVLVDEEELSRAMSEKALSFF